MCWTEKIISHPHFCLNLDFPRQNTIPLPPLIFFPTALISIRKLILLLLSLIHVILFPRAMIFPFTPHDLIFFLNRLDKLPRSTCFDAYTRKKKNRVVCLKFKHPIQSSDIYM